MVGRERNLGQQMLGLVVKVPFLGPYGFVAVVITVLDVQM